MFCMWTHRRAPLDIHPERRAVLRDGSVVGYVFWGMQGKRSTWFWEINHGRYGVAPTMAEALEGLRQAYLVRAHNMSASNPGEP